MEFLKVVSLLLIFLNGLYSLLNREDSELGTSLLEESKSKNISKLHKREKREALSDSTIYEVLVDLNIPDQKSFELLLSNISFPLELVNTSVKILSIELIPGMSNMTTTIMPTIPSALGTTVTSKTTTITLTSKPPVLLTATDPVYTDVVVELQIPVASATPAFFDEFRSILSSLKNLTSQSTASSLVVVDVNFTTVCNPNVNGRLQCQCEDQFAWSCDKCSLFGACSNVSEQTCRCINGLPEGEFCKPATDTPSCPKPTFAISTPPTAEARTTPQSPVATTPTPVTTKPTTFLPVATTTTAKTTTTPNMTTTRAGETTTATTSTQATTTPQTTIPTQETTKLQATTTTQTTTTTHVTTTPQATIPTQETTKLQPTTPTQETTTPRATTTTQTTTTTRATTTTQTTTTTRATTTTQATTISLKEKQLNITMDMEYQSSFNKNDGDVYKNVYNSIQSKCGEHIAGCSVQTLSFSSGSTVASYKVSARSIETKQLDDMRRAIFSDLASKYPMLFKSPDPIQVPNKDIYYGESVTLTCGPLPAEVGFSSGWSAEWRINDELRTEDKLHSISSQNGTSVLSVSAIFLTGIVGCECILKEGNKSFKQTGILRVKETPVITVKPVKAVVRCGITVKLECSVQGNHNVSLKDFNKQGSKITAEYSVPENCAGRSPETFICLLQSNPAFEKKITVEFTNEEFVCKDNPTFGSAPEGYVVKGPCEEGKLGEKTAECLATGKFGNEQNNCVLKEVKDLLDQSEKLTQSTLPGFLKKLSNVTVNLSKEVTDSPATIIVIVRILNNIGFTKLPIDGASMTNVLLTIDVLTSEDARTSWVKLNKDSENTEVTKSQANSSSSALLESIENITSQVQDEHLNIATNLIIFNKTTFTNSFNADFNSSVEVDILNSDEKRKSLTAITFFSMNIVLPSRDQANSLTNVINGKIILIQSSGKVNNISISYDVLNNTLDNPKCVFWDFRLSNGLGGWDDQGCILVNHKNGTVSCNCNHLTSFSILMSPFVPKDPALEYITYIGIGISMGSLVICLIIEAIIWRKATNNTTSFLRHVSIVNIALSLLIANIWFIVGAAISNPQKPNNLPACSAVTFFIHFFYLALFFWMLALGLLLINSTVNVLGGGPSKACMLAIGFSLGYGAPLVIAAVTVAVTAPPGEYVRDNNACWLNWDKSKALLAFVVPALLIVLINLTILATVISKLVKSKAGKNTAQDGERHILVGITKSLAVLTPCFGLTWGLGFGTVSDPKNTAIHGAFAFFNSLQGLFILVFGTLLDRKVRSQLSQTLRSQTGTTSVSISSALSFFRSHRGFTNIFHKSSSGSSDSSSVNT